MPWLLCESNINATSSAKSRSSRRVMRVYCMPSQCFSVVCRIIQSLASSNSKGDNKQPWRTRAPVSISSSSESGLSFGWPCCCSCHRSFVGVWCTSQVCRNDVIASTTLVNTVKDLLKINKGRIHRRALHMTYPSEIQPANPSVYCPLLPSVSPGLCSMMPPQFLHSLRSPFLGSLIR